MRFVSVDFECESLQEGLARMGFRVDAPAFVSWLGVTQYLTPAAIQSTLDLLGSFAPGSEVAVTYVVPDDLRDDVDHAFAAAAAALTAARGEPWLTFFHPQSSRRWFGRQGSRPSSISGQTRPPRNPTSTTVRTASVHRGSNDASPPAVERWRREDLAQAAAALLTDASPCLRPLQRVALRQKVRWSSSPYLRSGFRV